jgi:hypothetical protein
MAVLSEERKAQMLAILKAKYPEKFVSVSE